ncbi:MAG: hypothetical protein ABIL58_19930 [Pseudomonadota bacterium]
MGLNCAIYDRNTGAVVWVVENCQCRDGRHYAGSNMELKGVKEAVFGTVWTLEIPATGAHSADITPAPEFEGVPVSSKADVNRAVRALIRARYDLEDELKLQRRRLEGETGIGWTEYRDFVADLVAQSNAFIALQKIGG